MKLYFSGIEDAPTRLILEDAGIQHVLADPIDMARLLDFKGNLALDSGAYRAWKKGKELIIPTWLAMVRAMARNRRFDFIVQPDVLGDPAKTYENWVRVASENCSDLPIIPVWQWGAPYKELEQLLQVSNLVAIGGLVPPMRDGDVAMLEELKRIGVECGQRIHLLGICWLKAIQELSPLYYSGDTSKFLDGGRYGHVIFVNTKTYRLSQAPSRVIPEYAHMDRRARLIYNARTLDQVASNGIELPAEAPTKPRAARKPRGKKGPSAWVSPAAD